MSNLDDVKQKIASILEVTEGRGATEAEAVNAIAMAQKLMSKYGLTLDDIQAKRVKQEDFVYRASGESRKTLHEVDNFLAMDIAAYCDCKVYADRKVKRNSDIVYFGYSVDVELAYYIRSVIRSAMEYEWKRYFESIDSRIHGRTLRKSFMIGFVRRMRERLFVMKNEQQQVTEGKALVVAKTALVNAAFNIKTRAGQASKGVLIADPFQAGKNAANKVVFNRTVSEGAQGGQLLLGKR